MNNKGVLADVRVLDFTWVLAGPYATRILADFGAEVIKVQPLSLSLEDDFARGYYNAWNRNKLGITLDLNKPEGVAVAKKLVAKSDVVVENFTPRVMANWGLSYESLKKINPDIIMLSMSAMGHSGSQSHYAGFGATIQALSAMTALTSFPGEPPTGLGTSYADHVAGLTACLAVLSALEYRRKTGEGQYIDISQVEAMAGFLSDAILDYQLNGREAMGNGSADAAPHGVYRGQGDDRWCAISVSGDGEWQGFKKAIGSPQWTKGKKFATLDSRLENSAELDRMISQWTEDKTAEEVTALLQKHGVAAGLVKNAADLANDPQLKERGFFIELSHPELGKTISDAQPVRLSDTPAVYHCAAPILGQDNGYVYGELLGMSEGELSTLKKQGVI